MKFIIRKYENTDKRDVIDTLVKNFTVFEIPNITITWLTILFLIIQILGTVISDQINNLSKEKIDGVNIHLKEQNFKLQILQRVLELESLRDRKASIELLVKLKIFNLPKESDLDYLMDSLTYIPKWNHLEIEHFSEYMLGNSNNANPTKPGTTTSTSTNGTKTGSPASIPGDTTKPKEIKGY